MNSYIVLGIVIVAIGTGLVAYGQYVKGKADSDVSAIESDKKLQRIMADIESLKDSNPPPAMVAKIDKIEDEFSAWAAEFNKKKISRKTEFERNKLKRSSLELQISEQYREFFDYSCKMLEKLVIAYNQQSNGQVSFKATSLPENLYDFKGTVCEIVFSPRVVWNVFLQSTRPVGEDSLPNLAIYFSEEVGRASYDYLMITPQSDGTYRFGFRGEKIPGFVVDTSTPPMSSYEESLKVVLKELFEAQILALP